MDIEVFSDKAYYGGVITIGVLAAVGTLANGISLSFFLRYQRESLADIHLIALNITDLLICSLSPAALFCLKEIAKHKEGDDVTYTLIDLLIFESFLSMSLLSCFITTTLSVIRALVLTRPLYIIKKKYVYLAHGINMVFSLSLITLKATPFYMSEKQDEENTWGTILFMLSFILFAIQYIYVLISVGVVGISCIIVVKALRRPRDILTQQTERLNNENNRKASVMILTLSVIFVVMNGTWCLFWAICTGLESPGLSSAELDFVEALPIFSIFISLFLMTLNSCANPLVYMLRNSRLNKYTKSLFRVFWRGLTTCRCDVHDISRYQD